MEFKYPKDINRGQRRLFTDARPQPTPSKSELFMKELGLDDDDTLGDITSSSDEESSDETRRSEIEFKVLEKELQTCQQQRDFFQSKNRDFSKIISNLKSRLKKEETSKRMRMKIMQRAHADAIKDKHNLIMNLQDLIEESGDTRGLKMVSAIEDLHEEKADLHGELLKAQEDFENKLNEMEERFKDGSVDGMQNHQNSLVMEKIAEEKIKLSMEIEEMKRNHERDIESYEELLTNKEAEIIKSKQEKEKKRRSDNSFKLKLETLNKELEANKRSFHEKERELQQTIKKQKDEMKRTERERDLAQKELETLESDMMSRLTNQEALSQSTVKLEEESRRLAKELEKCRMEMETLREEAAVADELRIREDQRKFEVEELEATVTQLEANLEKHKTSAREKLRFAEHELEEAQLLLHQQRRESSANYEELKAVMQKNEKQLKREIEEANHTYQDQQKSSDKKIEKMEEKVSKFKSKLEKVEKELEEANSQLKKKSGEIVLLNSEISTNEEEKKKVEETLEETRKRLHAEERTTEEARSEAERASIEIGNLERRLALVSGESDSALAQMEKESGELRLKLNSTQTSLSTETKRREATEKLNEDLQQKISTLESTHSDELLKHKVAAEGLVESHKREVLKLKASSAIATEAATSKASSLESALKLVLSTLRQMSRDKSLLRREVERFPGLLKDSIKQAAKEVSKAVAEISETNKELVRKYKKEMKLRKKYHNELVELKGNIRVFVRTRPIIAEDGNNAKIAVTYDDTDDAMIYVNNEQKGRTQTFELDKVFPSSATQEEVYAEVQALVTSCMDGYRVCIFAYGQTGSGKTHTMEGTPTDPGINQRALADLFAMVEDRAKDWKYSVAVSLVEIYNETLRDLLNTKTEKLEIKMNTDGTLFVQRLKSVQVGGLDDVNKLFKTGRSNRATASTNMNERSSRSHAVLIITVEGTNITTGQTIEGKLNLIDLAGSERVSKSGASGDRLKEAQNINKSLSSLGDVIHALRNKQGHVPFRNSKLTYLLQDSLSKESKTLMVVQVSPIERSLGESVCSLTFAQRVRTVELGQATKKVK